MNWGVLASFLVALFLTPAAAWAATQSSNSSVSTKTVDGKTVVEYSITQTTDGKTETKSQSFEVTDPFQLNEQMGGSSINVSTSEDSTQTISTFQQSQQNRISTTTQTQTTQPRATQASGQTPTPTPTPSPTHEATLTPTTEPSPTNVAAPITTLTLFASPSPTNEKPDDEVTMRNNQVKRLLATAIILLVIDIILIGIAILLWFLTPRKTRPPYSL